MPTFSVSPISYGYSRNPLRPIAQIVVNNPRISFGITAFHVEGVAVLREAQAG